MLKYIFQTQNEITFAHHSASTGGNEAMLANLTEPGDTVIFAVAGTWGDRLYTIAERYGMYNHYEIYTFCKLFRQKYYIATSMTQS